MKIAKRLSLFLVLLCVQSIADCQTRTTVKTIDGRTLIAARIHDVRGDTVVFESQNSYYSIKIADLPAEWQRRVGSWSPQSSASERMAEEAIRRRLQQEAQDLQEAPPQETGSEGLPHAEISPEWSGSMDLRFGGQPYPTPEEFGEVIKENIAQFLDETVFFVRCLDDQNDVISTGSAFLMSTTHLCTAMHVVDNCAKLEAHRLSTREKVGIKGIVAYDSWYDLAILELVRPFKWVIPLESRIMPRKGESVFATGNPRGIEGVFSNGIISGFNPEWHHFKGALSFTSPVSPGSSGCPLVNGRGACVGIVTSGRKEAQNLNFATPVHALWHLLEYPPLEPPVSPRNLQSVKSSRLGTDAHIVSRLEDLSSGADEAGFLTYFSSRLMLSLRDLEEDERRHETLHYAQFFYEISLAANRAGERNLRKYQKVERLCYEFFRDWAFLYLLDDPFDVDLTQLELFDAVRSARLDCEKNGELDDVIDILMSEFHYTSIPKSDRDFQQDISILVPSGSSRASRDNSTSIGYKPNPEIDGSVSQDLDFSGSQEYKRLKELESDNDIFPFLKLAKESVTQYPESALAHRVLSDAYFYSEMYEDSLSFAKKAIDLDPKNARGWNNLAIIYNAIDDIKNAKGTYAHAVKIAPDDAKLLIEYGEIIGEESPEVALSALKSAKNLLLTGRGLDVETKSYELELQAVLAYIELGQKQHALECALDFRSKDPSNATNWIAYAFACAEFKDRIGEIQPALIEASKLDPKHKKNPSLHVLMGDVKRAQGDFDTAVSFFQKALALDGRNVGAIEGMIWAVLGRISQFGTLGHWDREQLNSHLDLLYEFDEEYGRETEDYVRTELRKIGIQFP